MKKLIAFFLAAASTAALAATTIPVQLINSSGSTAGQAAVSTGPSSAPAWGSVGLNGIAAIPANTILANATSSSANPTAFAMPSCSTSSSALQYASGSGVACNTNFANLTTANTWSSAQTFSALIIPTSTVGIKGTTTNDSPAAGSIGEIICAQVTNGGTPTGCQSNSGTPVALTTGVAANVTSLSLSAGDWDVDGVVGILPAGTTVLSNSFGGSSSTSAALNQFGSYWQLAPGTSSTGPAYIFAIPHWQYKLTTTTTVYCVAQASFGTSTTNAICYIRARRVR